MPRADWRVKLVKTLLWFIPRANPTFEQRFPEVHRWYVELDARGVALREIGVNSAGQPITAAPWGPNLGFWIDGPGPFPLESSREESASVFEHLWQWLGPEAGGA